MKHMKRIAICGAAALTALFAAACSSKSNEPTPAGERVITFKTDIGAFTRAPQLDADGSGSFTPGDSFTLLTGSGSASRTLEYTLGTTTLRWSDLDFAAEGATVDFAACYPTRTLDGGRFDFTVRQDASGDLLMASARGVKVGSELPVALHFRHAMHRLVVKYTVEDASVDASAIETSCTARNSCTVDLAANSLECGSTEESFSARGGQVTLLLVPQAADGVALDIRAGSLSKQCTLSQLDACPAMLEGGKELTVNLTIRDGAILFDGLTIEGWGSQGTIEDEISL